MILALIHHLSFFLSSLGFIRFNMPNQKSAKNNSIWIIFIKIIVKSNIIKININNTHFIIIKYSITRIFIKIDYIFIHLQDRKNRSSRPEVFLVKGVLKIAKQLYRNCTSAWVFSCKFAASFQNTFS